MDKSKIYLDLSKCTEEKKHIKTLTGIKNDSERIYLSFSPIQNVWGYFDSIGIKNKTELTYPEFIKLFEGGEGEKELEVWLNRQIEKCQELDMPREEWAFIQVLKKINSNQ